jgi:hypothetical protein
MGRYRITTGGSWSKKDPSALKRTYGDRLIIKDSVVRGAKYYVPEIGYRAVDFHLPGGTNPIYPTAKPFKLLERLICLSTR